MRTEHMTDIYDNTDEELLNKLKSALREKRPNTEFFLVRIFLYSE